MWKVNVLDKTGARRPITVVESAKGEPFDSSAFVDIRSPIPLRAPHLAEMLDQQSRTPEL